LRTKIIEERFGDEINDDRRRLVQFPRSSRLIPNPINNIPGFSVYDHHFVPGFPKMAWPMMEWVLDTHYPKIVPNKKREESMLVEALEGQIIGLMQNTNEQFPDVRAFSLPKIIEGKDKKSLVLGVKGVGEQLNQAMGYMQAELHKMKISWTKSEKM